MAKHAITPALTFTPGSGTLNLSGIANFDLRKLLAVLNLTQGGAIVYAPIAGFGITAISGTMLTLAAPLTGMAATDRLMVLYDDGGKPFPPTPVASAGYVTGLLAFAGTCTAVNIHASNASQTGEGYLVVIDAAAVPALNTAITPLKKRRLPTNDGTIDGTTEIDTPFSVQLGFVALLTTSLTQYVPGTLSGVIDASYLA